SGILALQTPKFYLAGSKRARKPGFLRSIDRKNPQFEQALSMPGTGAYKLFGRIFAPQKPRFPLQSCGFCGLKSGGTKVRRD
ncbi:MAG: hypothetical protein LBD09_00885, partial [Treponema sp.]|nr:hypothetical protein [Treponema sp.]